MFNRITLDGFFEGPNGEIDWHNVDDKFNQIGVQQTGSAGGLIFGRKTNVSFRSLFAVTNKYYLAIKTICFDGAMMDKLTYAALKGMEVDLSKVLSYKE